MKSWAGIEEALNFAQASLAAPPGAFLASQTKNKSTRANIARKARFVERTEPRDGDTLIFRAVLPLDLCPRMNELLRDHFARKTTAGKKAFDLFYLQHRLERGAIVNGRPLVRFVRFSTTDPDDDSSWTKVPLDVLVSHEGDPSDSHHMRFIRDDNRQEIELRAWWEPAGAKNQFVYLDVWEREER